MKLEAVIGDITKFECDAIVNAAGPSLMGGGGVDGAIHAAAGIELRNECKTLGGCKTGQAKATGAYRLPAKYVLHTPGPVWSRRYPKEETCALLADSWRNCLILAESLHCQTVAFPSISTGAYGFPIEIAASIAVKTVREYADQHPDSCIEKVTIVCFSNSSYSYYSKKIDSQDQLLIAADLHSHIVWGVDDGCIDETMSHAMLQLAYEQGIRQMAAVSHGNILTYSQEIYDQHFAALQAYAAEQYPDLKLCQGTEIRVHPGEEKQILEMLKEHQLHYLGDTDKALIELSVHAPLEKNISVIQTLLSEGLKIVIAHAERYHHFSEDINAVGELVKQGCEIQINAYSLEEESNYRVKQNARKLVKNHLVHYLGTDAHRTDHRPPVMQSGLKWLFSEMEREYATQISLSNAAQFFR